MFKKNPFDPGYYHTEELHHFGFNCIGNNVTIATVDSAVET